MKTQFVFLLLVVVTPALVFGSDDLILKPPAGKAGREAAYVFGQGALISTKLYEPIMQAIQDAVPFPLWIGVVNCLADTCAIPATLHSGVQRVEATLKKMGLSNDAAMFYGGHSLGGAMMPDVVNGTDIRSTAAGMILMGAFIPRSYKSAPKISERPQFSFPVPALTIGGELDGLCRVTRIAESLYSQVTFSNNPSAAARSLPVTIIEGMTHNQFASGPATGFVKLNDLKPEITYEDAWRKVAYDAGAFMSGVMGNSTAYSLLDKRQKESTQFTQPIIDALKMEGYAYFLPPCFCETKDEYGGLEYGTCVDQPGCQGHMPFTQLYTQNIIAGVDELKLKGLSIEVTDSIHKVTEEKPSCHLPHIHKSQYTANADPNANPGNGKNGSTPALCTKAQLNSAAGCKLTLTTVTQNLYDEGVNATWKFGLDTGLSPIAAKELRTKSKSRQAIWEAAGAGIQNFNVTDEIVERGGPEDLCRKVNQASLDWATKAVGAATLARFKKVGQKIVIGADKGTCAAGPCWIYDDMVWDKDDKNSKVTVQSIAFSSENHNLFPCGENQSGLFPCSAGFHYCKILSPARAVEWMYVDGLRLHYSVNNKTVADW